MKTHALLLSLAALFTGILSAQTPVSIPIVNPQFTDDQLACSPGDCFSPSVTGWIVGPSTGVLKASTVQFKNAPPQGIYVADIGNGSATGSIMQTLGDTLKANTTYVLKVAVGARSDFPFTGYEAALMAGNVILASGNEATPVGGSFAIEELSYSSGAAPAQLGKPLQIIVKNLGTGSANVAGVTLTATGGEN